MAMVMIKFLYGLEYQLVRKIQNFSQSQRLMKMNQTKDMRETGRKRENDSNEIIMPLNMSGSKSPKMISNRSRKTNEEMRKPELEKKQSFKNNDKSMQPKQEETSNRTKPGLQIVIEQYSREQLDQHREILKNLWEYRYWRTVENAIKTNDWLKVFSFIGEFKEKCLNIARQLTEQKFKSNKIDSVDHRYTLKGQGQIGIFFIDNIVIRVAQIKEITVQHNSHELLLSKFNRPQGVETQTKTLKRAFDKKAVKNLHQEFISNNFMNNLIISLSSSNSSFPKIRVPLTSLVEYKGYTFLFQADTMCQGVETMINGPIENTFQYREQAAPLLSFIGSNLNLKPFKVMDSNGKIIDIPFCLTTELHEVKNCFRNNGISHWFNPESYLYPSHQNENKLKQPEYYLIGFSKLWPLFIDSNIVRSSGYLRPEIVLSWKKELSNIVFSNIAVEKDELGELELAEACKHVKQDKIKSFVKFLDEATFFVVDSPGIEDLMHEYGINIKFLGLTANSFALSSNRRIFEVEMIARVLKKIFFTNSEQFTDRYTFKELFVDFLNLVFVQAPQGQKFYRKVIYPHVESYYEYKMTEYPPNIAGGGLLHAICYHFGIQVKIIEYPFFKEIDSIFQLNHIIEPVGLVKCFDLQTCQLKRNCEKFKTKKRQGLMTQAISELKILAAVYSASSPEGTYSVGSSPQSYYYAELAQAYQYLKKYEQAERYANLSLKGIVEKHADAIKTYCILIRYYSYKNENNRCLEFYEKSLGNLSYHLNQNHPLSISVYNTLGFEFLSTSDTSKCEKIFAKSFQICEQALGYMHSTSGKILLQLADLPLPPQKIINFLLQALTILENIETDKQKVRKVCMKISEMYEKMGNLTKMIQFARKSDHWRMEIIALQKLNQYRHVLQLCNRLANTVEEVNFMVEKSFSSFIKLLDNAPTTNLYKLFISLKPNLPDQQESSQRIFKRFNKDLSISLTIVDFVKNNLNSLIGEIPDLLHEEDFYTGTSFLLKYKDMKLKNLILSYMDILAVVGVDKSEKIFTEFRKTF